jgi:hypothetical protein
MDQHQVKEDSFQAPKKKAEPFGVPQIMHKDHLQLNFPLIRESKVVEDLWVKERHRWSKSLIIATLWDKLITDSSVTYHIKIWLAIKELVPIWEGLAIMDHQE